MLATLNLFWRAVTERLFTPNQAAATVLVSAAFAAAWTTLLSAAGIPVSAMPPMQTLVMLSPALLTLSVFVLAPWSFSRIRHL